MTSGLYNPKYYREAFLEIRKSMEVREEGMEVQEEATSKPWSTFQKKSSKQNQKNLIQKPKPQTCP